MFFVLPFSGGSQQGVLRPATAVLPENLLEVLSPVLDLLSPKLWGVAQQFVLLRFPYDSHIHQSLRVTAL